MKTKEIISQALLFLNKEELLEFVPFGENENLTELQVKEIEHLKKCFNLVYNEIATNFLPFVKEEEVEFQQGILPYNNLSESLVEIKKLSANGKNIRYTLTSNGISANAKNAKIKYTYSPSELDFEDEVCLLGGKLQPRVFAYGIAMEYSLICGLYDEAEIWENRYKNALFEARSKKSEIRLPARRWI